MKIDTRKDCKRMIITQHSLSSPPPLDCCFLRRNTAIPDSAYDNNCSNYSIIMDGMRSEGEEKGGEDVARLDLLGRKVLYEPTLIHTPVYVSTRHVGGDSKASKKAAVRLSEEQMHQLNDLIGALSLISPSSDYDNAGDQEDDDSVDTQVDNKDKEEDEEEEQLLLPLTTSSSSTFRNNGMENDESTTGTTAATAHPEAPLILGRVQVKILDAATNQEISVSRCARFMDNTTTAAKDGAKY